MNALQNICSGFTELSTDFSTPNFVDNVHNSVYNFIFSPFRHFSMWITFFRAFLFRNIFEKMFFIFGILYTRFFRRQFWTASGRPPLDGNDPQYKSRELLLCEVYPLLSACMKICVLENPAYSHH